MNVGIVICPELGINQDYSNLRRRSVYLLTDDSDADFDFYVFVDSKKARENNDFLMELFNFLDDGKCEKNYNGFVDSRHREKLKEWLGVKNDNPNLTVLNWLKIAIEKYPYRLFIAVDNPGNYKKSNKSEFIKKRICWISKKRLKELVNSPEEIFHYLYQNWLITIYGKPIKSINIKYSSSRTSPLFISATSPEDFYKSRRNGSASNGVYNFTYANSGNSGEDLVIGVGHHQSPDANCVKYSLSGSHPSFSLATSIVEGGRKKFYPWLCEAGIGIFIKDERVENWFAKLDADPKIKNLEMNFFTEDMGFNISFEGENIKLPNDILDKSINKRFDLLCMIVHQGIIDKNSGFWNVEKILKIKDNIPFFIITSGRGKPYPLLQGTKFLPFSIIESSILSNYIDKLILVKILMSIKRRDL